MSISMGTSGTMKDCSAIKIDVGDSARQELNTALYTDGFVDGYKQGKKDTQQWIPVSERLPEKGQTCLVCDEGVISIDKYLGIGNPLNWDWFDRDYEAWMPLPKPYKGEEE